MSNHHNTTYLITGATGNIGARVVDHLLARGARPRVLVRDADKARARFGERVDIHVGDLGDARSLAAAFSGASRVFLVNSGPEIAARDALAAELARQHGVAHIVKLSALGSRAAGQTTAVAAWHAQGEEAIRASGVGYTFVQAVGFMSNTLEWARSIARDGVVRASTGEGRIAMIDPEDIAAVATEALCSDAWLGQVLAITGPELLCYREMVAIIAAASGRPARFEPISDAQALQHLTQLGLPPPLSAALVCLWREVREGLVETVTHDVERVTGKPAGSFDSWARAHAPAFQR